MLAVDLSGSMEETDLELGGQPVTRLQVVKSVLKPFIERREGDRLGLILFGDQAYLQTPLTFDRKTLSQMLEEAELGLAVKKQPSGMRSDLRLSECWNSAKMKRCWCY